MSYADLTPGEYKAKLVDWGLVVVEKINQLKAVIKFELSTGDQVTWDGFFLKKDGTVNEKTVKTLRTCGFNKKTVEELSEADALDTKKELSVVLVKENEFFRVEWVNDGSREMQKVTDVKKLKGFDMRKVNSVLAQAFTPTRTVKNHADALQVDPKDALPF